MTKIYANISDETMAQNEWVTLSDHLAALDAEVGRQQALTRERDEARDNLSQMTYCRDDLARLAERRDAEVRRLREALQMMLDSAVPHPVEHPTMTAAWAKARAALEGE